jgi:hypothetical protein
MTASRLAAWTRRRLGLAAGGAALLWLPAPDEDAAAKKMKKCKKSEKRCGKKCVNGTCCPGRPCGGGECRCTRTVEVRSFCKLSDPRLGAICIGANLCPECVSSDECGNGFKCVKDDDFGVIPLCQPPCGFEV